MRISDLQARVDRWIFDSHPQSAVSLAFFRVVFGLFLLIFAMPNPIWLTELPDAIYLPPPGPFRLLDGFPSRTFFYISELILSISIVSLLFGVKTKAASWVTSALLIMLIGFEHCVGMIHHNRILISLTPLVLAWSTWGDRGCVERPRDCEATKGASWPLTLLALLLGLYFLSGGLPKLWGGWLDFGGQATAHHLARSEFGSGVADMLPAFLFEIGDYAVVAFEMGFILAVLLGIRWTRIFCSLAVLFHLSILVLVGIHFAEQLIVYAAFVDWNRLRMVRQAGRWIERICLRIRRMPWIFVAFGGVAYFTLHSTIGNPLSMYSGFTFSARLAYWLPPASIAVWYLSKRLRALVVQPMSL